ncbi:MAG: DUF4093 domain-containing protein [Clostridiales bacterium]|jgi:ribonuclease M5|nr:DUF4093 domain-containing protein [Clostridiales bacterium]
MTKKGERLSVKEAIIVEGRCDRDTLSRYVNAQIIETGGFQVFSHHEIIALIRKLAVKCGVIILTDSDGAGFLIRNHLKSMISEGTVKNAYIPDIPGKEKRKNRASKEGKLGVEGMSEETILNALKMAGATFEDKSPVDRENKKKLTKASLYEFGLSGRIESNIKRKRLLKLLELPEKMSVSDMLQVINLLYDYDEFKKLLFNSHILDTDRRNDADE